MYCFIANCNCNFATNWLLLASTTASDLRRCWRPKASASGLRRPHVGRYRPSSGASGHRRFSPAASSRRRPGLPLSGLGYPLASLVGLCQPWPYLAWPLAVSNGLGRPCKPWPGLAWPLAMSNGRDRPVASLAVPWQPWRACEEDVIQNEIVDPEAKRSQMFPISRGGIIIADSCTLRSSLCIWVVIDDRGLALARLIHRLPAWYLRPLGRSFTWSVAGRTHDQLLAEPSHGQALTRPSHG
ncbi:hypothetical protein ZIOFF_071988 [Zingiber officinale]|uniref:Uncharacterized protein n=1 Tax=Zingiber officinale TaxID=94328 RepID=A0A8J5C4I6_ZINOF|nr:hypothetical protein ZIOFF_071988 [Zingiber officinale]